VSSYLYRVFLRLYPFRYKAFLKLSSERSSFISERCCIALFLRSSRFCVTFSIICNSIATVSLVGGLLRGALVTLVISANGIPRVLLFLVLSARFFAFRRILQMVLALRWYEGHCNTSSVDVRDEFTIACCTFVHHLESLSCRFLEALGVGLSYDGFFFGILISSCDIIPDEMGLFTLLIVNAGLAPALVRVHGTHIKPTQVRRTRSKVSGL
jgi:hypothetical protein